MENEDCHGYNILAFDFPHKLNRYIYDVCTYIKL